MLNKTPVEEWGAGGAPNEVWAWPQCSEPDEKNKGGEAKGTLGAGLATYLR